MMMPSIKRMSQKHAEILRQNQEEKEASQSKEHEMTSKTKSKAVCDQRVKRERDKKGCHEIECLTQQKHDASSIERQRMK